MNEPTHIDLFPGIGGFALAAKWAGFIEMTVRIWSRDDDGKSLIHLNFSGKDYTICGHDTSGDPMVHSKAPKELAGKHRVTCPQCLQLISDVKEYLTKSWEK